MATTTSPGAMATIDAAIEGSADMAAAAANAAWWFDPAPTSLSDG